MKKTATALVALMFLGSISFAQNAPAKKDDAPKMKTEKKMEKKTEKSEKKKAHKTEAKTASAK